MVARSGNHVCSAVMASENDVVLHPTRRVSVVTIRLNNSSWELDDAIPLGTAGGFGAVFAGTSGDGAPVAIKRLHVSAADAAHRELRVAGEFVGAESPNIIPVLDFGLDAESDRYYIVMARAERSLEDEIAARGPLPVQEAVSVLLQVCDGLEQAAIVVHRDLKPANILFHDGRWKISDFGIARFLEETTSARTLKNALSPPYAAPEQWRMEHATSATDVYALGCIAHAILSGTPPFHGPAFRDQHLSQVPPRLDIDDRLAMTIAMMLRKAPESRPARGRVAALLKSVAENPQVLSGDGRAALGRAAAAVTEQTVAREATAAATRLATERRQVLAHTGISELQIIIDALIGATVAAAPTGVGITGEKLLLRIQLGDAHLVLAGHSGVIPDGSMPNCGWDPVAAGTVAVRQGDPSWEHGATLWYMRLPGGAEYRWYEASYQDHAMVRVDVPRGPYIAPNLREADQAAGGGMHTIVIEFGPAPIDGEDMPRFIDRWLGLLARAAQGRLRGA